MKKIETEISLEYSPSKVWQTLVQFENYPVWSKFIVGISGTAVRGNKIIVSLQPPHKERAEFESEITEVLFERKFRWKASFSGAGFLFSGEHYFILEPLESGKKTRLIHGEDFRGVLVPIMRRIIKIIRNGFIDFNYSLAEHIKKEKSG